MPTLLLTTHRVLLAVALMLGHAAGPERAQAADTQSAILAGGCFWCVESDFEPLPGVIEVISGFTGGTVAHPSYSQVSHGGTGHRESVKILFDPDVITYDKLLYLFFRSVDPLDAGGQFCDRGETYSTAIYVSGPEQRAAAEAAKSDAEQALGKHVVTPILAAGPFYPAEGFHQNYYKSQERLVFTRYGLGLRKATAYRRYRHDCGRDARVEALWGADAPFLEGH